MGTSGGEGIFSSYSYKKGEIPFEICGTKRND